MQISNFAGLNFIAKQNSPSFKGIMFSEGKCDSNHTYESFDDTTNLTYYPCADETQVEIEEIRRRFPNVNYTTKKNSPPAWDKGKVQKLSIGEKLDFTKKDLDVLTKFINGNASASDYEELTDEKITRLTAVAAELLTLGKKHALSKENEWKKAGFEIIG